jgi:hypothetical protein
MAAAGSLPVSGAMVTPMGTIVTLLAGTNGALVVLGSSTLTVGVATASTLTVAAATTSTLTVTVP